MNKLFLLLVLCAVAVNARWSLNYQGKAEGDHDHDHDEMDWWEHSTFYQIYPKSFKDSDGDGVGDLKGIISKLPHLAELGVTGAWLSPIFASPMKDGGYDISDFDKVDPMFGTNKDLEDLFAEAEKLGIKIILDLVPNHTSDQHEWFKKSVARETGYEDYYVWTDCPLEIDGTRRYFNNWIAVFHTVAWTYNAQRNQCYLHQFTPEQPDLNYRNEKVVDEMMNVFKVWLDRGADGFRIDAINHMYEAVGLPSEEYVDANGDKTVYDNLVHDQTMNRPESYEFIYKLRTMMDEYSKTATKKYTRLMMTEAYASIENQVKWYGKDEKNQGGHWPFNFALIMDLNKNSKAEAFHTAATSWIDAMPTYGMANWVLGNHDRPRVGYRYGEDRHESMAIMSMGLPGNNVIYYGEEILMTNNMNITFEESDDPQARQTNETVYLQYSRDPVRTPFQWDDTDWAGFSNTTGKTWLPIHANYKTQNLAAQKTAAKSTFKLYQKLLKIRKDNHVLQSGGFESKAVSENVYGYMRTLAKHDTVAVFLNLGEATKVNLKDLMGDEFNDKVKAKILIVNNNSTLVEGQMVGDVQSIELGKYDAVMLEVSSATKIAVSLLLLMCSLIKFIF